MKAEKASCAAPDSFDWILELARKFPGNLWDDDQAMRAELLRLNRLLKKLHRHPITQDKFVSIQVNTIKTPKMA